MFQFAGSSQRRTVKRNMKGCWLLSKRIPAPCNSIKTKDELAGLCVSKFNLHIRKVSGMGSCTDCCVFKAEPLTRDVGCLLPCGWRVKMFVSWKVISKFRTWSLPSLVSYLKNLHLPLTPINRSVTDRFCASTSEFALDGYDVEQKACQNGWFISVTVGTTCYCVVERYMNHFFG